MVNPTNPFEQTLQWITEAQAQGQSEPTAVQLGTLGLDGFPQVRTVLFKSFQNERLIFFTNYQSTKGKELLWNSKVGLNFFWPDLFRQIRLKGLATPCDRSVSEDYFSSRPRLSQLGAWASDQSEEIPSYEFLQNKLQEVEKRFGEGPIPCPPHWGGFEVSILSFEFWLGREGRLHERFCLSARASRLLGKLL